MKLSPISKRNNYSPGFSMKFKLSDTTMQSIEKATGLSRAELTELSIDESQKLMKKRGTLKEPGKVKTWLADKYRKIGESLGLLEKKYNIYKDID